MKDKYQTISNNNCSVQDFTHSKLAQWEIQVLFISQLIKKFSFTQFQVLNVFFNLGNFQKASKLKIYFEIHKFALTLCIYFFFEF